MPTHSNECSSSMKSRTHDIDQSRKPSHEPSTESCVSHQSEGSVARCQSFVAGELLVAIPHR
jgi:hypothetical protein